jgi:F0F1-type ATP synthase membrane subunit c/vacuolar-type H+-ATPase subunit K
VQRESTGRVTNAKKEITMEYLILVAVVSMMALYALIIVGCLKQPEW